MSQAPPSPPPLLPPPPPPLPSLAASSRIQFVVAPKKNAQVKEKRVDEGEHSDNDGDGEEMWRRFVSQYGSVPSRAHILEPNCSLQAVLQSVGSPQNTLVALDFDQTLTSVSREVPIMGKEADCQKQNAKSQSMIVRVRGGEESVEALRQMHQNGAVLCIVTAQPPSLTVMHNLRHQLVHLGLARLFNVSTLDPAPIFHLLLARKHFAPDIPGALPSCSLYSSLIPSSGAVLSLLPLLTRKLLLLLLLFSELFPTDLSRLSASSIQFQFRDSSVPSTAGSTTGSIPSDSSTSSRSSTHPISCTFRLYKENLVGLGPEVKVNAFDESAKSLPSLSKGLFLPPIATDTVTSSQTLFASSSSSSSLYSQANALSNAERATAQSESKDTEYLLSRLELCPVRCLQDYLAYTSRIRHPGDTDLDLLFIKPSTIQGEKWHSYSTEELSSLVQQDLQEAGCAQDSWKELLEEQAVVDHMQPGMKVARLGNCLACGYNKPEAVEYFIRTQGLDKVKRVCFVDDNSDNAYNMFTHFADKQISRRNASKASSALQPPLVSISVSHIPTSPRRLSVPSLSPLPSLSSTRPPSRHHHHHGSDASESFSQDAPLSASPQSCVGEDEHCLEVHSFWYTPPSEGRDEHHFAPFRRLFQRLALHHHHIDTECHGSQ